MATEFFIAALLFFDMLSNATSALILHPARQEKYVCPEPLTEFNCNNGYCCLNMDSCVPAQPSCFSVEVAIGGSTIYYPAITAILETSSTPPVIITSSSSKRASTETSPTTSSTTVHSSSTHSSPTTPPATSPLPTTSSSSTRSSTTSSPSTSPQPTTSSTSSFTVLTSPSSASTTTATSRNIGVQNARSQRLGYVCGLAVALVFP